MSNITFTALAVLCVSLTACGGKDETPASKSPAVDEQAALPASMTEIGPGLSMRVLRAGDGATATAGQVAIVHYTGWLYDDAAADHRGAKFDSSVDRDQYFRFPLGAGRVIKGWDNGVVGMQVGELRELTIAPELAYGDRGAGDVIPPGSTLVFEVELVGVEGEPAAVQ